MGFEDTEDKSFGDSLKGGISDAGNWVGRQTDAIGEGFGSLKNRVVTSGIKDEIKTGFFGGWGKMKMVFLLW